MHYPYHILAFCLAAAGCGILNLSAAEPLPYGHQDFVPTPERPMIFRAGGNGWYPGATPPTEWSEGTPVQIDMRGIYGSERKESVHELGTLVQREGVTVFLTTHNLAEAERLCSRVAVIKQGRLLAVGHPDELKARSATRAEITGRGFNESTLSLLKGQPGVVGVELTNGRLVLELAETAATAPLVAAIVQHGGLVEEVRKDKGSLEDVFLTLMEEERGLATCSRSPGRSGASCCKWAAACTAAGSAWPFCLGFSASSCRCSRVPTGWTRRPRCSTGAGCR